MKVRFISVVLALLAGGFLVGCGGWQQELGVAFTQQREEQRLNPEPETAYVTTGMDGKTMVKVLEGYRETGIDAVKQEKTSLLDNLPSGDSN